MNANRVLFVDLSSNNKPPNLRRYYRRGYRVLALKATESTVYTWDEHGALADRWHQLGGSVVHYHFARPGDGAAQAAAFIAAVKGHWRDHDRLALDAEVPGVDQELVAAFIGHCHDIWPNRPGVIYSYASFLTAAGIRPVHGWGLWLAGYGDIKPKPVTGWKALFAWQSTDHATVPGMPAPVDCSYLYDLTAIPAEKEPPVKNAIKKYAKAHVALVGAVGTWAAAALSDGKVTTSEWEALATAVAAALGVALIPNKTETKQT